MSEKLNETNSETINIVSDRMPKGNKINYRHKVMRNYAGFALIILIKQFINIYLFAILSSKIKIYYNFFTITNLHYPEIT